MDKIEIAVFNKETWVEAYSWEALKVREGYQFVSTTYGGGLIVKIVSNKEMTQGEKSEIFQKATRGEIA